MFQYFCLAGILILSFSIRLFPVILWGSVIHEYDPHFNFRVTKYLIENDFTDFLNWYDDRVWYPLGRAVGRTTYPGLMLTSALLHRIAHALHMTLNIRHICVLFSPFFSVLTAFTLYRITFYITNRSQTALLAALFMAICPGYISRSTAGSYDNEGIAIFLLVLTFGCWMQAVEKRSMLWGAWTALSYFCMVSSWGGFVFIINLIPLHALVLLCWQAQLGMQPFRIALSGLYVVYSTFYTLGTLLALQVPVIGMHGIFAGEMMASHGMFVLLQVLAMCIFVLGEYLSWEKLQRARVLLFGIALSGSACILRYMSWTGRSLSLLLPWYAREHVPIIASVGEHQATPWSSFYASLGPIVFFVPLGVYVSFDSLNSGFLFMLLYATLAFYFAGIMIRLILVVAPVACFLSAVGISYFIQDVVRMLRLEKEHASAENKPQKLEKAADQNAKRTLLAEMEPILRRELLLKQQARQAGKKITHLPSAFVLIIPLITIFLYFQICHSVRMSRKVYSSTSLIIEQQNLTNGEKIEYDDLREAYQWIRHNTPEDSKILSWWDYGYQLSQLGNRTVIVDNNTCNNTHIASVGRVFMSSEEEAMPILRSLDVDYVMITFGGKSGMRGDDMDKAPWIVRITEDEFPDHVLENDYKIPESSTFLGNAANAMTLSLLYRMSYYEFDKHSVQIKSADNEWTTRIGYDANRNVNITKSEPLRYFTSAFTSDAWIVRIYKVNR